ncbi:hypothetical protein [Spirosoma fluminis]
MKKSIFLSVVLMAGLVTGASAQSKSAKNSTNGVVSQQGKTTDANTSSVEGMQRKGSGKMASGVSRNGNSNLSPTSPTNTQGSTSQGSASVQSAGGAKETRTKQAAQVNAPKSTKNGTASDGGLTSNGTPKYGAKVDQNSTSGSTGGSKRPTSTTATRKEANTSDKNVSTGYPQPTGAGKAGTPSGSASGKKAGGNSYPQGGSNGNQ